MQEENAAAFELSACLSAADRARLAEWRRHGEATPGPLPAGVVPVRTRRVRAVGRGRLPDDGDVYVKVMGFPRPRDRIRYLFRALPAVHEARVLRYVARRGIPCPAVLAVWGRRRRGLPRLSCLVTRALPGSAGRADPEQAVLLAGRLADSGVYHPDFHMGNIVGGEDGVPAVLDLQSARIKRRGLCRRQRVAMLAKLLSDPLWPTAEAAPLLVRAGVLSPGEAAAAVERAARIRREETLTRIRRCLRDGSGYSVSRRWGRVVYERRVTNGPGGVAIEGGRELLRWWLGDRTREVLDGAEPALDRLCLHAWWVRQRHRVQTRCADEAEFRSTQVRGLEQAYSRYRALARGRP
ncbi:MAG: hypothetical protein JXR37_02950 [Kiritimatiellae bacterium]|nr:hypothetical protein [Kiritimatiellia bacterium]